MASRKKKLQDRSAAIVTTMKGMTATLEKEDRNAFNEDEQKKFDLLKTEARDVDRALAVEIEIEEAEKNLATIPDANRAAEKAALDAADKANDKTLVKFPAVVSQSYNLRHFAGEGRTQREWNEQAYSAGRFLMAAIWHDALSIRWCQEHGIPMRSYDFQQGASLAMSGSSNTAGAILVPDELSSRIIDLKENRGVFARYADIWPMTSDNLTVPRRLSGLTAYFVGDQDATTESTMALDGITLSAKELAVLTRYPISLSEDTIINLGDRLTGEIAYAMADKEDQCGFNGDGTQTYGGIRGLVVIINDASHGNSVTTNGSTNGGMVVAAAGGTSFGATVLTDYERMVGVLPAYAAANAAWYFSRAGFAAGPQRLIDAAGGNTNATLSSGGPGSLLPGVDRRPTFLGYPVNITQVLNSTLSAQASTVVGFFGDLAMASSYGSRRMLGVASSTERYFEYRQVAIQGVERFDINNHDLGTTTAAGPIVGLKLSAT